ncbi:MAG: thioredoxin family protein [Deltaproteobacteria bacterium]|nr:thioredoxin family protein [Deltaproteobacteria bacterium]
MNDVPLQRQIKIGRASIGLAGLDVALSRALGGKLNRREAVEQIFTTISNRNYIPSGMRDAYREALAEEYDRLRDGETGNNDETLTIRILGPGCVSCNNIQKLVIEIMADMQVKADIVQIHDLDEIGRMGVMQTPALIINGQLKSTGRLPARSQIEEWLREAIDGD